MLEEHVAASQLSTTEDTEDAEENPVLNRFEPPVLRVPRGGEVILVCTLRLAMLAIAAHLVLAGVTAQPQAEDDDAALEKRVHAFSQQVRCLVCQNETLADSHAELAVDLRREIREQMKAGRSDEQISAFLTERYGDFVLYRPPLKPSTYPLWFGPFVVLGGGLWALYRCLKRWPAQPGVRPLSAGERKRVRQLLETQEREETA